MVERPEVWYVQFRKTNTMYGHHNNRSLGGLDQIGKRAIKSCARHLRKQENNFPLILSHINHPPYSHEENRLNPNQKPPQEYL